jgi:hypothetical protein
MLNLRDVERKDEQEETEGTEVLELKGSGNTNLH